jgi:hypothetical protein
MVKSLTALAAAGLAVAALALAVPLTGHAQGSGGPCFFASKGHPVQHTGTGHTSFSDSHDNCVRFNNTGNTAFLDESDGNSIVFNGTNNIVEDFRHSDNNTIFFDTGSNNNEVNGNHANNWNLDLTYSAVNDFVSLLGNSNASAVLIFANDVAVAFDSACTSTVVVTNASVAALGKGSGTESNPILIC